MTVASVARAIDSSANMRAKAVAPGVTMSLRGNAWASWRGRAIFTATLKLAGVRGSGGSFADAGAQSCVSSPGTGSHPAIARVPPARSLARRRALFRRDLLVAARRAGWRHDRRAPHAGIGRRRLYLGVELGRRTNDAARARELLAERLGRPLLLRHQTLRGLALLALGRHDSVVLRSRRRQRRLRLRRGAAQGDRRKDGRQHEQRETAR